MDFLQKYQYNLINLDNLNTLIKTIKDHENLKYESESLITLVNNILNEDSNNEESIGKVCLSVIISFLISFIFVFITLYLSVKFGLMWALILMLLLYFTVIILNPKKYAYLNNIFIRAMAIMLMFITIIQTGIDNKNILPYFNNFDAEFKNILMIPFALGFIFLTELTLPKSNNVKRKLNRDLL